MTAYTGYARELPHVLAESAIKYFEAVVPTSMNAADTLQVAKTSATDITTIPLYVTILHVTSSTVTTPILPEKAGGSASFSWSFDPTTGNLNITADASATIVAGDKVVWLALINT